jgi:hypothetical protein
VGGNPTRTPIPYALLLCDSKWLRTISSARMPVPIDCTPMTDRVTAIRNSGLRCTQMSSCSFSYPTYPEMTAATASISSPSPPNT